MGLRLLWISLSLFAFAWLLDFNFPPRKPPLVNYDNEVFFDPSAHLSPSSKEELIGVIKKIAASSREGAARKVRVVGSGHSWSSVAKSDDLQISLSKIKGLVSVDLDAKRATFYGGTTFSEMNTALAEYGLAMSILGSISDQTVAGAIATGTHGSGIKFGNIASYVTKLELVTGKGELLTLHANDSGTHLQLFRSAQVSLGLLGVITEVTVQCEPSFNLRETRSSFSLSECLSNMNELVNSAEHVKMWIEVFSESCAVFRANRTEEEPRDNPSPLVGLILNLIFEAYIVAIAWVQSVIPFTMRFIIKYGDPTPPYNRVDISHKVFNIPHYFPRHHEAEVVVEMKDGATAIQELMHFVNEDHIPLNFISEVRFVRGDNIPLSPNFHRDSCHLTLCINNPSEHDRERYFQGVYRRLMNIGLKPRIHWGKSFNVTAIETKSMYPNLTDFLNAREILDPHKMFVNQLLSHTLGIH